MITAESIENWLGIGWENGRPDRAISGVTQDTRTLKSGNLYIAIRGPRFDGHAFLSEARTCGAAGALVDAHSTVPIPEGLPVIRVDDPIAALGRLATACRSESGMTVVGITGSSGKTTVKEMIGSVLGHAGPVGVTRGNYNNEIGLPLSMLSSPPEARYGVFEIGMNAPGEIAGLSRIMQPDIAVVTNVGPVHLENFSSVEAIADEKGALLQSLKPDGVAVLDADHEWFEHLKQMVPGRLVTVGTSGDVDYQWSTDGWRELSIRERGGEAHSLELPLPGEHNSLNAVMAVAVGRQCGLEWETILSGLLEVALPPMRWEAETLRGVTYVNDAYNANPVSMRVAVQTFSKMPCSGRRWLVIGDMLELGEESAELHRHLGAFAGGYEWAGVALMGSFADDLAQGFEQAEASNVQVYENQQEIADYLMANTLQGDAVLLKGSRGMHLEDVMTHLMKAAV